MRAKACDTETPVPVVPSPKFQLYEVALVEALASKVHVRDEQLLVKLGDGAGGAAVGATFDVVELVPFASVTVRVTPYVPAVA